MGEHTRNAPHRIEEPRQVEEATSSISGPGQERLSSAPRSQPQWKRPTDRELQGEEMCRWLPKRAVRLVGLAGGARRGRLRHWTTFCGEEGDKLEMRGNCRSICAQKVVVSLFLLLFFVGGGGGRGWVCVEGGVEIALI